MLACTGVSLGPLDEQQSCSDTNKMVTHIIHSRDTFMLHPNCTQLFNTRRCPWFVIAHGCRTIEH